MENPPVRITAIKVDARFFEPKYGAALVTLDKGGIELQVSVPLDMDDGAPPTHVQIAQFFRDAAEASERFSAAMSRALKGE
ncbi:hypothetical protein [Methylobacterium sp. J-070]|uniref:hypothetical protein n=1 Tax=Methylobacterium sp. J-070 TaxID=2836650 RepID=UPI001FBA65B2|nr:hypothetical protein [Methylobacterium sp. J-070]MCJ2051204.1 hypothetical protein [Methylobacterium sp. J-070]